jgi:type IV pilus assembly protein PilA
MKSDNGFSLVELIVVIAIMAALAGIMAPQYVKYYEKAEKRKDCAMINAVLDTCEVIALDPDTTWGSGDANAIEITVASSGMSFSGGTGATMLDDHIPDNNACLQSDDWGPFTITATRADNGRVSFEITDAEKDALSIYSTALSARFE